MSETKATRYIIQTTDKHYLASGMADTGSGYTRFRHLARVFDLESAKIVKREGEVIIALEDLEQTSRNPDRLFTALYAKSEGDTGEMMRLLCFVIQSGIGHIKWIERLSNSILLLASVAT